MPEQKRKVLKNPKTLRGFMTKEYIRSEEIDIL